MDRATTLTEHEDLRALRTPEEVLWKQIAELIRPEDQDFQGSSSTSSAMDEIFDSTPLYALDDFVGGLFGQLTNPANDWFALGVPDDDLMLYQPVKQWFWSVKNIVRASLGASFSSFYTEVPAWFADCGAFGMGVMYSEEQPGLQRISDRAIPLREVFIDVDFEGRVNRLHREFTLKGRQILGMPGFDGVAGIDEKKTYKIVHAVFENPDHRPGRAGPAGKKYLSHYVSPDHAPLKRWGGYNEFPYFIPMWSRRSSKVYPRGPGHVARPDMRTLQEMERAHLTAAEFAADPMKLLHGEADLTEGDFYPGALLLGTMSDDGKRLMETVQHAGQLQLSMAQSEQRRQAVRQAFYFSLMQLINRPQMTATEFQGFQEERLRQMAPNLERIQQGGLTPFILRRFRLLERAGQLPPPPPELEKSPLTVEYLSPLAKVQKMAEGRAAWNFTQQLIQLAQVNEEAIDLLDIDKTAAVLHASGTAPPSILRAPQDVEQRRAQRSASRQQQVDLENAKTKVEIAATAGHAEQAATLAKGRAG